MKKIFAIIAVFLISASQLGAVVNEESMDITVRRLNDELVTLRDNLEFYLAQYENQRTEHWAQLSKCMHDCQEYSIVLYTKSEDRLFALSNACQNLQELMEDFERDSSPFENWKESFIAEVERFQRLEELLSRIKPENLTSKGEAARIKCIEICEEVHVRFGELQKDLDASSGSFDTMKNRIKEMAEYNTTHFEEIRKRVFLSSSGSYLSMFKNIGENWRTFVKDIKERANPGRIGTRSDNREKRTLWLYLIVYFIISASVASLIAWKGLRLKVVKEAVKGKRVWIGIALTIVFLISVLFIIDSIGSIDYFRLQFLRVFMEFFVILAINLISIILVTEPGKIWKSLQFYLPLLFVALIVILERAALSSNHVVNCTIPMVFAISSVWQFFMLTRHGMELERGTVILLWATFLITTGMGILAWCGYTFLALVIMFYWIAQISCLQIVSCMQILLTVGNLKDGTVSDFRKNWLNPTVDKLMVPILVIGSIVLSFPWSAKIFSMNSWARALLQMNLLPNEEGMRISISAILLVIAIAFVVSWLLLMIRTLLQSLFGKSYYSGPIPLYVTLGSIFAWFIFGLISMSLFNISSQGLVAAVGGMGVGLGFALKDTINDLFCGISLLMGRVHLNDIIECDGVRGRITEIGIRSTTVETLMGNTISFLNSQLFQKNFCNLTKNHKYELCIVEVGVAYGTDVEKARNVIIEAIQPLEEKFKPGTGTTVHIGNFGDSSVDLQIKVWLKISERGGMMAAIREATYKAFAENGIEIPFPQRDVHIIPNNDAQ